MKSVTAIFLMAAVAAAAGELRGDVERKLDTRISLDLRGARLADALDVFRSATGLNFVAVAGAETPINIVVADVSVRSALRLLLAPRNLTAVLEDGAVVIRDRRCLAGGVVLRVYDVRASLVKVRDFPAPLLGLDGRGLYVVG